MNHHRFQRGFTLLEVLIAVALLSIIAIIMVRGLQTVIKSKERINAASAKMEQLQLAMLLLHQDLQQAVNRPIFDNEGKIEAAMVFSIPTGQLNFTRSGFTNPDAIAQRSTLERIAYRFEDEALQRLSWPVLDRTQSTIINNRILLTQIKKIAWRFLANDNSFYEEWPPDQPATQILPKAIELQLTFATGEQLTQLIIVNASDEKKEKKHRQREINNPKMK